MSGAGQESSNSSVSPNMDNAPQLAPAYQPDPAPGPEPGGDSGAHDSGFAIANNVDPGVSDTQTLSDRGGVAEAVGSGMWSATRTVFGVALTFVGLTLIITAVAYSLTPGPYEHAEARVYKVEQGARRCVAEYRVHGKKYHAHMVMREQCNDGDVVRIAYERDRPYSYRHDHVQWWKFALALGGPGTVIALGGIALMW